MDASYGRVIHTVYYCYAQCQKLAWQVVERNLLAIGKRDQARVRVRDCLPDSGPADFKEMPSRRRRRGLAVDHQHL